MMNVHLLVMSKLGIESHILSSQKGSWWITTNLILYKQHWHKTGHALSFSGDFVESPGISHCFHTFYFPFMLIFHRALTLHEANSKDCEHQWNFFILYPQLQSSQTHWLIAKHKHSENVIVVISHLHLGFEAIWLQGPKCFEIVSSSLKLIHVSLNL